MGSAVSQGLVERAGVKALRAAVGHDDMGVLRALQRCRGWGREDVFRLCLFVAGRAADVLAETHGAPLGGGRWIIDEELLARHKASPERFAARFLLAAANLDEVECRRLWGEQVDFARHVVGARLGDTTVIRVAVVAVIAQAAKVHMEKGVMP